MNKISLFLVLILSSLTVFSQRFEWKVKHQAPKSVTFYDVKFVNSNVGVAVGNNDTNNYIMLTLNGGETWTNIANAATSEMVNGVEFIDENTIYVIGRKGSLYKTTNQGSIWTKINLGTNANLRDISFPSANKGYICSEAGRYLYYDGIGWVAIMVYSKDNFINVKFPNVNEGILTSSTGRVWRTENGGTTWDTIKKNLEAINGSHFLHGNLGYIVGPKGMAKRTINGGISWSDTLIYPKLFKTIDFYSTFFVGQNFGFIGGSNGTILRTSDGGTSWHKEDVQTSAKIMKMYCISNLTGFAVSSDGKIMKRFDVTSVNENISNHTVLFPNPAANNLIVDLSFSHPDDYKLEIFDISGKQLFIDEKCSLPKNIDISFLTEGLYLIRISNDHEMYFSKFVKK